GDVITPDGGTYQNVTNIKSTLTSQETSEFQNSQASHGGSTIVSDNRWGRPPILNNVNQPGDDNTNVKSDMVSSEINSVGNGGQVSTSWLNDDSIGARFAKRIANAG